MIEFFIAKKQMLERKKQSILSIVGVFIGITVLIVSLGVSNGLDKNMINSILSLTSHINVYSPENIPNYEELVKNIEEVKGVKGAVPTIETQGIIKYEGHGEPYVAGVKVVGYDLDKAIKVMKLDDYIIDGKIDVEDKKSILIGKELAASMGAMVGDKVKLITSEETDLEMTVGGIFQSGFYEYDLNMVLIPLQTAQYITYSDETVGRLSVRLDNPYDAQELIYDVARKLPTDLYIGTWGEQNRALLSALTLEKTIMLVVFSLIAIVAGFLIWITLNTLVREKTKDIGIMRAMGFSKKNIMLIFLIQGIILGIIGIILGIIVSLILLYYIKNYAVDLVSNIYYLKDIPIEISLKEIAIIVGANFIVILISSIFPAYRAAKLENVEALRYE
ncbi:MULTISPECIES: ABC transporter permease [Fusobacterium]|jgi:lipoprotein releasing system transmembrane protein lolE|uniref:ABC transporter permease n=2 Tax=Fusobacterium TaxID=848 RepID=A0A2G9EGW7_9FUSO|nr:MULTISPECIES: ABC transporter permease [Fusobacterium]ATV70990.1 ABC transporter permease [Fusobacterium pseudoperiodonticum]EKA93732.1 LolC/E family lipoprotein releasing system, transmembrane protein [Fusobacterium periodonticum D10]MBF1213992.1 ABC transporter permease [Fusobacterium periodonticum]PIM80176.1 ABC transporter permease [Fusobacterium pseudoperiodonticum]